MKLSENIVLPSEFGPQYSLQLVRVLRQIAQKANAAASGALAGTDQTGTAAPTTGTFAKGDFIRNSAPAEAGVALSKYVVTGWVCTVGGTPGTWVACRSLTGN